MAYTSKFQRLADNARAAVDEVLPHDVAGLMAQGAVALDIRDPDEHAQGHIPGSGHHYPVLFLTGSIVARSAQQACATWAITMQNSSLVA